MDIFQTRIEGGGLSAMSMRQMAEEPPKRKERITDMKHAPVCLKCTAEWCKGWCEKVGRIK